MGMDPELKKEWVAALRSGEYKQTGGLLHTDEGFCCLGVLCDIAEDTDWVAASGISATYYKLESTDEAGSLSHDQRRRFGLVDHVGILIAMNDGGSDFSEIADYIEEHL